MWEGSILPARPGRERGVSTPHSPNWRNIDSETEHGLRWFEVVGCVGAPVHLVGGSVIGASLAIRPRGDVPS